MISTEKLIEEALSLPTEERALIADSLLHSLNKPDTEIDAKWTEVAKRRLHQLRSGEVQPIPGDEVFARAYPLSTPPLRKHDPPPPFVPWC